MYEPSDLHGIVPSVGAQGLIKVNERIATILKPSITDRIASAFTSDRTAGNHTAGGYER